MACGRAGGQGGSGGGWVEVWMCAGGRHHSPLPALQAPLADPWRVPLATPLLTPLHTHPAHPCPLPGDNCNVCERGRTFRKGAGGVLWTYGAIMRTEPFAKSGAPVEIYSQGQLRCGEYICSLGQLGDMGSASAPVVSWGARQASAPRVSWGRAPHPLSTVPHTPTGSAVWAPRVPTYLPVCVCARACRTQRVCVL